MTTANKDNQSAEVVQVRKLYKTSLECVKCLDKSTREKKVSSIFLPEVVSARNKLRECCERLMFLNPIDYGRKAEDMIWKKCFYEPIQICRQNKDKLSEEQKSWACLLLSAATGYYHSLMIKIQKELEITLNASFPRLSRNSKNHGSGRLEGEKKPLREWAIQSAHKCLIYLGDIARYQVDFKSDLGTEISGMVVLAEYYYSEAIAVRPFHGMPFNQLGTLFGMRNWGADGVYFYLRCLSSEDTFDGVKGNLTQVFSRNEKIYETMIKDPQAEDDKMIVKSFLVKFLHLMGVLFEDKRDAHLGNRLQYLCQQVLEAQEKCLSLVKTEETPLDPTNLSHVDSNLLLKIVLITVIVIKKLQTEESTKLATGITFLLSSFAQILDQISMELSEWPIVAEIAPCTQDQSVANGLLEDVEVSTMESLTVTEADKTEGMLVEERNVVEEKKMDRADSPPPMSRRRKADDSESEEEEDQGDAYQPIANGHGHESEDDDVIELPDDSEDEAKPGHDDSSEKDWAKLVERAMSPAVDSGCQSGETPPGDQHNEVFPTTVDEEEVEQVIDNQPFSEIQFADQYESLAGMGFLSVVKVVCDWFRSDPKLIVSMTETSKMLWHKMSVLLNLLPHEDQILEAASKDPEMKRKLVGEIWAPLSDWYQKFPLPEDIFLRGVSSLSQAHCSLDFSTGRRVVDRNLECFVRLFAIRSFGEYLVRLNAPGINYDTNEKKYTSDYETDSVRKPLTNGNREIEDGKGDLMRSMAKLRARDEQAQYDRIGWIPVYLIPEVSVLLNKLSVLKQLAGTQRFVCVIPSDLIKALDGLKKDSADAREAIRFLETCFRQGSKYIRAQKSAEKQEGFQLDKAVSKELTEMLSCCAHLCGKVNSGGGSVVVTILTVHKPSSDEFKTLDAHVKGAGISGTNVDFVHAFWSRWQAHRKKGG